MLTTIIMVSIALTWLLIETDYMRVRLEIGPLQWKSEGIETVMNSTAPVKSEPIICRSGRYRFCELSKICHKDKERWFGYKIPAKTMHLFGHTQTFKAGCNQLRAGVLKDIIKAQTSKSVATYKPERTGGTIQHDNWLIELSANGKTLSVNGDYKPGMIRQFVKANK